MNKLEWELSRTLTPERIGQRIRFWPQAESLDDFAACRYPLFGAKVLTIASYGGYPLHFLAEGADHVVSCDIEPDVVEWNRYLRSLAMFGDFEMVDKIIRNSSVEYLDNVVTAAIHGSYPAGNDFEDTRMKAERILEDFGCMTTPFEFYTDERLSHYPMFTDQSIYERISEAISSGSWDIEHAELIGLIKSLMQTDSGTFDVIYISNVRKWLKKTMRNPELFEMYEKMLAEYIDKLSAPGAVVHETDLLMFDDGQSDRQMNLLGLADYGWESRGYPRGTTINGREVQFGFATHVKTRVLE